MKDGNVVHETKKQRYHEGRITPGAFRSIQSEAKPAMGSLS